MKKKSLRRGAPLKLEDMSKQELLDLVKSYESRKKYGLVWEDDKTREHFEFDNNKIIPVLHEVKELRINNTENSEPNYLIEGDNFYALNILKYTHQGRIDLIYIDPPYNTGNKDFKYNDVFIDKEDTFRHSKWLSFMNKRLQLAKDLLSDTGTIFISIGDDEQANLKLLMDSIFGENNFVDLFLWNKTQTPPSLSYKSRNNIDYVLCYEKKKNKNKYFAKLSQNSDAPLLNKGNGVRDLSFPPNTVKFNIPDGVYKPEKKSGVYLKSQCVVKNGVNQNSFTLTGEFKWGPENLENEISLGTYFLVKSKNFSIRYQKVNSRVSDMVPNKLLDNSFNIGTNEEASSQMKRMGLNFSYPKPVSLIKFLINMTTRDHKAAIILDFFAGSGTTGESVLQLNKEDSGNRKFILVTNNEENICEDVTYPRIQKVMQGFTDIAGNAVEGLGGSLNYLKIKFIKKTLSSDEMKIRITDNCVDLLCFREGVFDGSNIEDESFRLFSRDNICVGIYTSFDYSRIEMFKSELKKFKGQKKAYIFTFDNEGLNPNDFIDWDGIELEPIPQKILEVIGNLNAY